MLDFVDRNYVGDYRSRGKGFLTRRVIALSNTMQFRSSKREKERESRLIETFVPRMIICFHGVEVSD